MKTVFEKEILVTEQQEKTNIAVPFSLPTAAKQVVVHFSYAPKKLEGEAAEQKAEACLARDVPQEERCNYPDASSYTPLLNLITVSVDDPEGYRGCAHRQAPQQTHVLSAEKSAPGFLLRDCPAGNWCVTLHVHALVTGSCTCKLLVEYEEGEA